MYNNRRISYASFSQFSLYFFSEICLQMPVAFRYGNISIYNENGNILSLNNFAFYNYIEILSSHISNNLKLI